jgi:hypothetical protein
MNDRNHPMIRPTFHRVPPSLAARIAYGIWVDAAMRPFIRVMEKLGRGDRVFRGIRKRQIAELSQSNPFDGYAPTEHDVFVATYAKSGTNWMMQIVHQLLNHARAEYEHIHQVVAWPTGSYSAPKGEYAIPLEDDSVWKASPENKRVIKTHFHWNDLPYSRRARYIIVIRDPKEVFVSSYFFFGAAFPLPSLDTWYRLFCSQDFPIGGSWAESTAGYWAQRDRENVLIVSFKALKRDLAGTVRRVATFLDVRATDQVIRAVCSKSCFEYMKRAENKFAVWNMIPWRSAPHLIRKGPHGGPAELLDFERQVAMDAHFARELKRLGCDLDYQEVCEPASRVAPGRQRTPSTRRRHPAVS